MLNLTGKIKPARPYLTNIIQWLQTQSHSLRNNSTIGQHVMTNLLIYIYRSLKQSIKKLGLKPQIRLFCNLPSYIIILVTRDSIP